MPIADLPTLDASVTEHTIPTSISAASSKVVAVRDWAHDGSRPADWGGGAADAASHSMTQFADDGDGVVLRLTSAAVALGDYIDTVVALRDSLTDLSGQRTAVVAAQQQFLRDALSDPLMQDPFISGMRSQELRNQIEQYNLAALSWINQRDSAEETLVAALAQSLPTTPDHLVGLVSSYLTPSEAERLLQDLWLDPNNPELLAQLDLLIETYGDDAGAWDALYEEIGPDGAASLFQMLGQQYEYSEDPATLARAEAMRNGFALATERWTDSENADFAQALVDTAAQNEHLVAPVAFLFSTPPEGGQALDGDFSLAAANALYEYETGEPPVRIRAGQHEDTRLYYAATGADVNRPGFMFEIDLAGPVLESLAASPEHSLEHLSHAGRSEHWLNGHWWDTDGYQGVTAVWDSALSAPGGVVYPPPAEGPAYDPLVAATQARLMSEFFADFAIPTPHPWVLTDDAMTSLGNISAKALPFASWVATEQTGTSDDYVFLGMEQYTGAYLPTFSDADLARVMGLGIEQEAFTDAFSSGSGAYTAAVLEGIENGTIDGLDGMKSIVTATAVVDGLNERIGIESGAGADAFTDGVGLFMDVASYLPGGAGVTFEVGGWALSGAEYLGLVGGAEDQARADSLEALVDRLVELEVGIDGESYSANEIEDLRRFYSEQYQSLIILPG